MDYTILGSVIELGAFAFLFGTGLGIAVKKFAVKVDPRVSKVEEVLPSANCGACGYPGCSGFAKAVVKGEAPITGCTPGGKEVAEKIADILGKEVGSTAKQVAICICHGGENASVSYKYDGIEDCRHANSVAGGPKACMFACLGLGSCADACPFDAIKMENGLPVVDYEKCTACGVCIQVCPKDVMQLVPYKKKVHIGCNSTWKGKDVKSVCSVGCIGCRLCVKNCPADAIEFENNLAKINYDKCINCGICVAKCPTKAILDRASGKALPEPSNPAKTEKVMKKLEEKKAKAKAAKKAKAKESSTKKES
ncbi:MAG: RnfABCDGE type electron transport complex subunit B [Candidatus Zixiibacteriota bacterium]